MSPSIVPHYHHHHHHHHGYPPLPLGHTNSRSSVNRNRNDNGNRPPGTKSHHNHHHHHHHDEDYAHNNSNNNDEDNETQLLELPREWLTPADAINTRWADIIGADSAIEALQQAVTLPVRFPEIFLRQYHRSASSSFLNDDDGGDNDEALGAFVSAGTSSSSSGCCAFVAPPPLPPPPPPFPFRALCLVGPPGTGKSSLASATAAECGAALISVSAADLLSKYIGESEKSVRKLFAVAASMRHQNQRCIIFLDEIDALCSVRGSSGETEAARRIKTEFLVRVQQLQSMPHVLVLAATNFPDHLDTAFCRRFDQFIYVGLPSEAARFQILCRELSSVRVDDGKSKSMFLDFSSYYHGHYWCSRTKRGGKQQQGMSSKQGSVDAAAVAPHSSSGSCDDADDDRHHPSRSIAGSSSSSVCCSSVVAELTLPEDAELSITDVADIAMRLEGYSGSDLTAVAKHALINPVRRLQRAAHFRFETSSSNNNNNNNNNAVSSSCVVDDNHDNKKKNIYRQRQQQDVGGSSSSCRGGGDGDDQKQQQPQQQKQQFFVPCAATDPGARRMRLMELPPGYVRPLPLCREDLAAAVELYPRTCTVEQLQRYDKFNNRR